MCKSLGESAADTVESQVVSILKKRGLTVAVAEACTSGIIATRLTNLTGSSQFFLGGVLAYSNEVKEKLLCVPRELMVKEGSVSEATAKSMAKGVRNLFDSDIAVSATGVMGPTGGTERKPVGLFFIAVIGDNIDLCAQRLFTGNRVENRDNASTAALELLLEALRIGESYATP